MSDKIEMSAEKVTAQLVKSKGNISKAARQLHVSRMWLHTFINDHEDVSAELSQVREHVLDDAETMLQTRMKNSDTLLIFFLKTQGKARGYVERTENTGKDGNPLEMIVKGFVHVSPDEWDESTD